MYVRVLTLLAVVTIAYSHDVIIGSSTDGRKIFDENRQASPAIWRQVQNVTVNATDAEVISRVVVTDQRPEKDGEAKVIDGGEGQKSVTLELKSPTALRGYDFHIEIYTSPDDKGVTGKPDEPNPTRVQRNPENADKTGFNVPRTSFDGTTELNTNVPILLKDMKVNGNTDSIGISSTEANYNTPKANFPTNIPVQPNNGQVRNSRDSGKANDEGIVLVPKSNSNPVVIPKLSLDSQNTNTSSEYDLKTSESPRTSRDTQTESDNKEFAKDLPTLVPLNVAKNLDNVTRDLKSDERSASEYNERQNDDGFTTPYYSEHQSHIIPTEPKQTRNIRDTVKTPSTQIPRLLSENKPTVKDGNEPELKVLPAQRFNGRTSTTPKGPNVRIARDSEDGSEPNPPIFQNAPETPVEDSRLLFQANNLPFDKPTTTATTTTTTAKTETKRDTEAEESSLTQNPKLDDDRLRAQNGTKVLPTKPVISLQ